MINERQTIKNRVQCARTNNAHTMRAQTERSIASRISQSPIARYTDDVRIKFIKANKNKSITTRHFKKKNLHAI